MGDKSILNKNTLVVSLLLICLTAISGVQSEMTAFKKIYESLPEDQKYNAITAAKK
jgi:uncharacterized BrkB/YihY/UPF0761 family membrane protein